MRRNFPPFLLLLAVVWVGGPCAPREVAAEADGERRFGARLDDVLRALGSPDAERRRGGLDRLRSLVAEDGCSCHRAVRALADLLRRRGPGEASRAVAHLAAIPSPRARALWLGALDEEAHPAVFGAAVAGAALRRDDAQARRLLLDLARERHTTPGRRALVLEALGVLGGAPSRLVLSRPAPGDGDVVEPWLEASGRALGLGHLGGEEAVASLLDLLGHPHPAPRVHAWEGLVALTGRALPAEAEPWRRWWASRSTGAPAATEAPAPRGDRYALPTPVHTPRYYGVPIARPRSHVVFCLDVSQSMYGRGIEQARGELERTLTNFPSTYAFDVVAFNENVHPFADELLPAHPVVKARALAWLAELETTSYTNLYDAVERAFGYAGVGRRAAEPSTRIDSIFLLSDGAPNRGRHRREDRVVAAIAELSERRIPVHTVAAGEEVFPLLRRIAEVTGGRFVDAFEFD